MAWGLSVSWRTTVRDLRSLDMLLKRLYHPRSMRSPQKVWPFLVRLACPSLRPWEPVAPRMLVMMSPVVVCWYLCLLGACTPGTWRLILPCRDQMTFHPHRDSWKCLLTWELLSFPCSFSPRCSPSQSSLVCNKVVGITG